MRSVASGEAFLTWLLFFGNGCFMNSRLMVCAERYSQYDFNKYSHRNNSDFIRSAHPYSRDNPWQKKASLTCNCSWGSVPGDEPMAKIVGGKMVGVRENYPMMAGIQDNIEECVFCGGSILTEYHVLTAAHCVYEEDINDMSLVFGVKNRCREKNNRGQYIPLLPTLYVHDYYDHIDNHNDIAIVLAARKIIFTPNVGPACIYTEPFKSMDEPILILGWGRVREDVGPSKFLLKVFVKRIETSFCKNKLPKGFINNNFNLQLCTYGENKDACGGDSGGPLFVVDNSINRLVQIALVSMGKGCGRIGNPAVNTALFPYLGWIQWTIEKSARKHFPRSYDCRPTFCHIDSSSSTIQ